MPRKEPGLTCLVRDVRFIAADTTHNRRKAQQLIEKFSQLWADEFTMDQGLVTAEPIKVRTHSGAEHGL